jgi:hypothetical protein
MIIFDWVGGSEGPEEVVRSVGSGRSGSAQPSAQLAPDYEWARYRDESLDRLVEWPAQRECLGDVHMGWRAS